MRKLALIFLLATAFAGCKSASETTPPARALCENCKNKPFIMNVGKCFVCDAETASGAFELCEKHAWLMNKCQACMKNPPVRPRTMHEECAKGPFTRDISNCTKCNAVVNSGSIKLCGDCSLATGNCAVCKKPLN